MFSYFYDMTATNYRISYWNLKSSYVNGNYRTFGNSLELRDHWSSLASLWWTD